MSENSLEKRRVGRGPSAASRRNVSTMNRPDSGTLNSNAQATVAASVFARMQEDDRGTGNAPAIANGFIPPVLEKKEEVKVSPFKTSHAPVKRTKDASRSPFKNEEDENASVDGLGQDGPQIAKFTPIPVISKPASPFVPLNGAAASNNTNTNTNVYSQVNKRPITASINHTPVSSAASRPVVKKSAFGNKGLAASAPAQSAEVPAAEEPVRTQDKTFVPLAPVPFFAEEDPINPFAAPVKKTETEQKRDERALKEAMEKTRSVEPKKSTFDKIMDELHKPLF